MIRPSLLVLAAVGSLGTAAVAAPAPDAPPPRTDAAAPAGDQDLGPPLIGPPAPGGLTSDVAARRAASTSPEVRARAEESAAALAGVAQARAGFVPRLAGTARYTHLSAIEQPSLGTLVLAPGAMPGPLPPGAPLAAAPFEFPVVLDQYATQITLQLPLTDYFLRVAPLTAAARGNARAAALMEEASRLRVATDARVAYYDWARAHLQIGVATRAVAQARRHLKDAEASHALGAGSRADVLRVEAQVANAELLVTRAQSGAALLARRLQILMHDPGTSHFEIGEDLRSDSEDATVAAARARPQQTLLEEALARRPEPRALSETAQAARAQARAALAPGLPRLDAVANGTYARPNLRFFPQQDEFRGTWDAGLLFSWAPTDLFGAEAGRTGALAHARQVEAERAALADGIETEIARALLGISEAEASQRTAERGLVAAEESNRVRLALFQNGRATSIELTDAENELTRARFEVIGTRIDRRIAEARLRHAVGLDVESAGAGGSRASAAGGSRASSGPPPGR